MSYKIKVKRLGFLSIYRTFVARGHSLTNATVRVMRDNNGKEHRVVENVGPMRLEIFLEAGGAVVYGDVSRIAFKLGRDWFEKQTKEVENESGGLVKPA